MRFSRLAPYIVPLLFAGATVAFLQAKCNGPSPPPAKQGHLRIATYNVEWMNEGISKEREANLRSVIANVNPDILAMQEIQSRKALGRLFGPDWKLAIADDLEEDQELALAVRKPFEIISYEVLFKSRNQDFAFPGRRNALRVAVRTPAGERLHFYVIHLKSRGGPGGRKGTDKQRIEAAQMLLKEFDRRKAQNLVVLGDFNDTPDDASLNILESANPRAVGKMTDSTGPFLHNLMQPLHARDYITQGAPNRHRAFPEEPIIKGARRDNDKWRGKYYSFPNDLAVVEALFDQILVSSNMARRRAGTARIYAGEDARRGMRSEASLNVSGTTSYDHQGSRASDHLPVYADFKVR
ncbi:MAG: endonuclease/exonuclease/phosphatase family protein [Fimbriimonadales bacterium]